MPKNYRYKCVRKTFNVEHLETELAETLEEIDTSYGGKWELVSTTKIEEGGSGRSISMLITFMNQSGR